MYSSLSGIKQHYVDELSTLYTVQEINTLYYRSLEQVVGLSKTDVLLQPNAEITADQSEELLDRVARLKQNEPIQYIDQNAYFYNLNFYVDPSVLIPRPETEELVHWVLQSHQGTDLKVLDIGTGSGAIPISLKVNQPNWDVSACDISNEALVVARRNARELITNGDIHLYRYDILGEDAPLDTGYDIIISNPPYVLEKDKEQMAQNVLDYEPHLALFVPNDDALKFYKAIASFAESTLKIGGTLYFEVHEDYAFEVQELLQTRGFNGVEIKADLQEKNRMVRGVK